MTSYVEDEYLSLSALQHILFCERQCALIHIEQLWIENKYTAEGRLMHERVDRGDQGERGRVKIEYSLPLKSVALGIVGKADVVEFHLENGSSKWTPFPVEYKRGKPKKNFSDKVQLCAQGLCLEEMFDVNVKEGALFYGKSRRRLDVEFDKDLRQLTIDTVAALHNMFASKITPSPRYGKKCKSCSFFNLCMPKTLSKNRKVSTWLKRITDQKK